GATLRAASRGRNRPPGTDPGGRAGYLEAEGPLDGVALAALRDGPLAGVAVAALRGAPSPGVAPALHAAQRAALEVDDLPGHDASLRDRGVARRRARDLHRAGDRVERVVDVADR